MQITSTQFQQKVGYYLGLVDQGETIEIKKLKPLGKIYELKAKKIVKAQKINKKETKGEKILKKIRKYKYESIFPKGRFKDSVEYQRWVRS